MRLIGCGNFLTVLELPTGSILRLFIPLIVDLNSTTIIDYDYKFIFADVVVKRELVMVEYTKIAFFIELPRRIY